MSIATFLRQNDISIQIVPLAFHLGFNKNWSPDELRAVVLEQLKGRDPILVGVSNQFTGDFPVCLEILKTCKEYDGNFKTVIGGSHVSFLDAESLESPYVDIVVRGEGEWTMLDLVRTMEDRGDLQNVKGITFKLDNEVIRNPGRAPGDLSELPPLDFSLLPSEFVRDIFIHGMLSRGCDFKCNFCGESAFWGGRRLVPVSHVAEEMEVLDRAYDNPMSALDDSMEYIGSERFRELCDEIKKRGIRLHKNFYIMSRVDSFSEDDLKNLDGTGIGYVQLGIESASPKVLKMMNKKIDRQKIIDSCTKLKRQGIKAHGLWMIGHPGDNPDEAQYSLDTLEYLLKNDLMEKVDISVFTPCPGTDFFNNPEKYGIEMLTRDWSSWIQPIFYITNLFGGGYQLVCQLKDFSADEIMHFYKKAHMIVMRLKPEALRYTHAEFNKSKRPSQLSSSGKS